MRIGTIVLSLGLFAGLVGPLSAQEQTPEPPPFAEWLADFKAEARERGIGEQTLEAALDGVEPNERVIELDREQPEFTQTLSQYLDARVSDARIERGREKMAAHRETLRAVAAAYGVQPRFIAAIWGMETNYGETLGGMQVVRSLVTLAWDTRRSAYFRRQLFSVLEIIDAGHIPADKMVGSWAGALGQPQFMPASFKAYAEDFDGDGRRDIWTSEADVFASIANYLASHGWRDDMTWGRQVRLPDGMSAADSGLARREPPESCVPALKAHTRKLSLQQWQARGVRRMNGQDLPTRDFQASLIQPEGSGGAAYLTYSNFRALLSYNCSNLYALAVGHLADALRRAE